MLKLKGQPKTTYQIEQKSILFFKNVNLVENETQQTWECSFEKRELENWIVTIKNSEVDSKNEHDTQNVVDFSQMLNQPLNEVSLLLNYKGSLSEVLNKKEILSKWEQLKKQLETHAENTPELKKVIKQCDIDFKYPTDKIKTSLLYFLLLAPVYHGQGNNIKRKFIFPSIINSGEILINSVHQKYVSSNDEEYIFDLSSESTYYGDLNLRKKFKNELSKYLESPFDYRFSLKGTNTYTAKTGLLKSSITKIKEQASADFYYNHTINIKQTETV